MILSEDDARKNQCPYRITCQNANCVASWCMGWRWHGEKRMRSVDGLSVHELELSVRATNCLKSRGYNRNISGYQKAIETIGELRALTKKELRMRNGLGKESYEEIRHALQEFLVEHDHEDQITRLGYCGFAGSPE